MEEFSNTTSAADKNGHLEHKCSSTSTTSKALEEQIDNLKVLVNRLKDELERKENGIAKLARDKEKLTLDLARQKRSNSNILRQLEDERKFYFQEKEIYCQEMNEIKEFKKNLSRSNTSVNERSNQDLKNDLETVKQKLKQTLEANYNLSIKFLRIKNTKGFLRNELVKLKIEHEKVFNDLRAKIEMMTTEIEDIVENRGHIYASPSNRKYVQLVRQNSSLVHENLCLQMEIERLNSQFEKVKLKYTKSETNNRLKYVHSLKSESQVNYKHGKKEKKVRIATDDKPVKTDEKRSKHSKSSLKTAKSQSEVVKIYERSEFSDTPSIQIMTEEIGKSHHHKKHKKTCKKHASRNSSEELINDNKKELHIKKESTSNKSCSVKLASIAEIDENDNTTNKNLQP